MLCPLRIDQDGLDVLNFLGDHLVRLPSIDELPVCEFPVEILNTATLHDFGGGGQLFIFVIELALLFLILHRGVLCSSGFSYRWFEEGTDETGLSSSFLAFTCIGLGQLLLLLFLLSHPGHDDFEDVLVGF